MSRVTAYSLDVHITQFWNQSFVPCLILTAASWLAYRFLRRQVRWSGIPISFRTFYSLLWSTQSKALPYSIKQKFFWNSLAFLMIQWMLAIWSLVPLSFLNPAWTSGSSQFTYYRSLTWRILSITLLACEMSAFNLNYLFIGSVSKHSQSWELEL